MKQRTNFLQKLKGLIDKEFVLYTGAFFAMMMVIYLYAQLEVGADAPACTYAEF